MSSVSPYRNPGFEAVMSLILDAILFHPFNGNEKCIPAVNRDAAGRIFSQKSLPEYLTVTMITCFSVSSTR